MNIVITYDTSELSRFAGRYGLDLILTDDPLVEDKSAILESDLTKRDVSLTPAPPRILEQPV